MVTWLHQPIAHSADRSIHPPLIPASPMVMRPGKRSVAPTEAHTPAVKQQGKKNRWC
ncbi:hypothetical protein [Leptolyngbya ohadii]|uniref:hypothetical protein n=1 Tax=Leptolyngbya ohadii TaxID=1962290 RepID=UPI0015C67E92|nr:hypothetical protein [Leptolyngbya ohadii]